MLGTLGDHEVDRYRPLVRRIRRGVAPQVPANVEEEDLLQEGIIACVLALSAFDPARGVSFEHYVAPRIAGAMRDYLRRDDWMPRSVRDRARLGLVQVPHLYSLETSVGDDDDPHDGERGRGSDEIAFVFLEREEQAVDPFAVAVESARREALLAAMVALPRLPRTVMVLHYFKHLTMMQIAPVIRRSKSYASWAHREGIRLVRARIRSDPRTRDLFEEIT